MKNYSFLLAVFLACLCLAGCSDLSPFKLKKNALIIKPSPTTRADNCVVGKDGSMIYSIDKAITHRVASPAAYIHAFDYIFLKKMHLILALPVLIVSKMTVLNTPNAKI